MNILNLIQSQFSPQAIGQISNAVGESDEGTKSAIGTALPALMGSLLGKVNASPDGAGQVFNTIQQSQSQGGWTDSIGSLLSGAGTRQQQATSTSMLNSLLGPKLGGVSNFIASHCGVKGSSAMSILGLAAPLLLGTLGKQVSSQNLGAAGLGQLLNSQAEHLKDALPSGLANTLGIGSLLSGSSDTTRVPTDAAAYQQRGPYARSAPPTARSHPLKWALPLLLVVGLGAWALLRRSDNTPAVGGTADYSQTQTGHGISTPNLSSLNLTPGSIADKVSKAISSGDLSQKINLDGLNFDSAGHLADSANAEMQQLGSVLKAAPNVRLSVTCYGATEEEGIDKANSLKSTLLSSGIANDRIFAHGEAGTGVTNVRLMQ